MEITVNTACCTKLTLLLVLDELYSNYSKENRITLFNVITILFVINLKKNII